MRSCWQSSSPKIFIEQTVISGHTSGKLTDVAISGQDRSYYRPYFEFCRESADTLHKHQIRFISNIQCTDKWYIYQCTRWILTRHIFLHDRSHHLSSSTDLSIYLLQFTTGNKQMKPKRCNELFTWRLQLAMSMEEKNCSLRWLRTRNFILEALQFTSHILPQLIIDWSSDNCIC